MRVLVGCEFSGAVRDAFRARGHEAMSCDLLDTDVPGPHYKGDIFDVLRKPERFFTGPIDLGIFHPPCTYSANSGFFHVYRDHSDDPAVLVGHDRWKALIDGAVFFRQLLDADIPKVAVENPLMVGWAAKIIGRKQDQVIHPYEFGHLERKATGLWLRGLPPLVPTEDVKAATLALPYSETAKVHHASPGPERAKERSKTYAGIARAMAEQWGEPGRDDLLGDMRATFHGGAS